MAVLLIVALRAGARSAIVQFMPIFRTHGRVIPPCVCGTEEAVLKTRVRMTFRKNESNERHVGVGPTPTLTGRGERMRASGPVERDVIRASRGDPEPEREGATHTQHDIFFQAADRLTKPLPPHGRDLVDHDLGN